MTNLRIGLGTDRHRLEPGLPLVLGGVPIESDLGAVAHSDGDVVLHALVDALLGSCSLGDIGALFPDDDRENRNRASSEFVVEAVRRLGAVGAGIVNVDVTVSLESPRIGPHRESIRASIAALLQIDTDRVSVKAKSGEKVDAVGRREAIEAICVCLVER